MVNPRPRGFTLIELLVALAILGVLLSIVTPRYFGGVARAEESVLRENLYAIRDALDKHHGDTGRYPDSLGELVAKKYLRSVPVDPITHDGRSWVLIPPADASEGGIFDVKSGANGVGRNGKRYDEW
jgi:general secretion pathway protein G